MERRGSSAFSGISGHLAQRVVDADQRVVDVHAERELEADRRPARLGGRHHALEVRHGAQVALLLDQDLLLDVLGGRAGPDRLDRYGPHLEVGNHLHRHADRSRDRQHAEDQDGDRQQRAPATDGVEHAQPPSTIADRLPVAQPLVAADDDPIGGLDALEDFDLRAAPTELHGPFKGCGDPGPPAPRTRCGCRPDSAARRPGGSATLFLDPGSPMTAVADVPGSSRPAAPSTMTRTRNVRADGSLTGTRATTRPGIDSPGRESANTCDDGIFADGGKSLLRRLHVQPYAVRRDQLDDRRAARHPFTHVGQPPRDDAGKRRRHDVTPDELRLFALRSLTRDQRRRRELGIRLAPRELGLRQSASPRPAGAPRPPADWPRRTAHVLRQCRPSHDRAPARRPRRRVRSAAAPALAPGRPHRPGPVRRSRRHAARGAHCALQSSVPVSRRCSVTCAGSRDTTATGTASCAHASDDRRDWQSAPLP